MFHNSHFVEKGIQRLEPEMGKSMGLRLKQDELAALNQLFEIDGLPNNSLEWFRDSAS